MPKPEPVSSASLPAEVRRAIEAMRWRVRVLRACRYAITVLLYSAAAAALTVLCAKLGWLSDRTARRVLYGAGALPLLAAAVGLLVRAPALHAAQLLDRAYDLHDRLSSALAFGALAPEARTPMMDAALDDAAEKTRNQPLATSRAMPWRWPAESLYALGMVALLVGVSLVEFRLRVERVVPVAVAAVARDPLLLTEDDLDAFRTVARDMEARAQTNETRQALDHFNRFIEQLSREELDRQEAYRRLQALQDELEHSRENDRDALRDAMQELGRNLQQNESTRELAQALQQPDPRRAAEAMHNLAQQLRENRMSEQQRQDLQQALQRATARNENSELQEQLRRAREETERLLRQQREHPLAQDEQRLLRQRQRELERLQTQAQRQEQQRRQLARLDRAMSQAMQDLARDMAQAAQDMDQGAEDLNRMQEQELSQREMEELRQQLEDLRQRMRQQNGQNGQQQRQRQQRFAGQARGGMQPGGQSGGRMQLGPGGRRITIPGGAGAGSAGQGQSPGQGQGQGQGEQPGNGVQAGTGHDENIRGARTSLQANMRTVQVNGQQRGNGPTRSTVIRTAAQEGFTTQGYSDVHAEYWNHAQEVVHAGEVPPGYRSYVRRYFQLIRPRE